MRIEKKTLNDALRVLGKMVCQTSPVELYRSVRFAGVPGCVRAMVTDGIEVVSVKVEADNIEPVDFCVEFKVLRELVRVAKDYVEVQGKFIEVPEMVPGPDDAVSTVLPAEFSRLLELAAPIVNKAEYRRVLQGINLSAYGVTATDGGCPDFATDAFQFQRCCHCLCRAGTQIFFKYKLDRFRFCFVDVQFLGNGVRIISENRIATTVFATLFCSRNFITNPFGQNFALKLSKCHQNIQHHPPGTRPGVDFLRDRTKRYAVLIKDRLQFPKIKNRA